MSFLYSFSSIIFLLFFIYFIWKGGYFLFAREISESLNYLFYFISIVKSLMLPLRNVTKGNEMCRWQKETFYVDPEKKGSTWPIFRVARRQTSTQLLCLPLLAKSKNTSNWIWQTRFIRSFYPWIVSVTATTPHIEQHTVNVKYKKFCSTTNL
jgi:hypothetical protein